MDSAFFLTSHDHEKELPLTEQQFRDLKRARKRLSLVFAISHKFRLVMSNFALIELQMTELGALYVSKGDVDAIEQLKPSLNASINNYVLSARIFTSQLKRHVQGCLPTERQLIADLSQAMDTLYQRSFAYRFVDALYDYVAYYGLSCHAFLTDSRELSQKDGISHREYEFKAFIERDFIGGPADFRASVLSETPQRIDIQLLLSEYNSCMQVLHDKAMAMTKQVAGESHAQLAEFVNVFVSEFGEDYANVFVVHKTHSFGSQVYDRFPISMYVNNHNMNPSPQDSV